MPVILQPDLRSKLILRPDFRSKLILRPEFRSKLILRRPRLIMIFFWECAP